jgi:hypothetical protein
VNNQPAAAGESGRDRGGGRFETLGLVAIDKGRDVGLRGVTGLLQNAAPPADSVKGGTLERRIEMTSDQLADLEREALELAREDSTKHELRVALWRFASDAAKLRGILILDEIEATARELRNRATKP